MTIHFYTNPMSRGRVVRWMLEEVGVEYETQVVQYGEEMKGQSYREVNPMGKVPAIRHDGDVVTEVAAICAYLADTFPDAELAPRPGRRAEYYRWLFFAAGPLEHALTNHSLGFSLAAKDQVMVGYGHLDLVVEVLSGLVSQSEYVAGTQFTAADLVLCAQLGWAMEQGNIPALPEFETYVRRLHVRPAYGRALSLDNALLS